MFRIADQGNLVNGPCVRREIAPYLSMPREVHHTWLAARLQKADPEPGVDATAVEQMCASLADQRGT